MSESIWQPQSIEVGTAERRMRLEFLPQPPRWQHRVLLGDGEQWHEVARSADGDEHSPDDWPPCPPIQEVVPGTRPTPSLLAIGASTTARWSLAVTARDATTLSVEVACRVLRLPASLSAAYRAAADARCEALDDAVRFASPWGSCRIVGHEASSAATDRDVVLTWQRSLTVVPATVLWRYDWQLES